MTVDGFGSESAWAGELSREEYSRINRRPKLRWLHLLTGILLATSLLAAGTHPSVQRWLGRETRHLTLEEAMRILATQKDDEWAQNNACYAIADRVHSACKALADKAREPGEAGLNAAIYLGGISKTQLKKIIELLSESSSPHAEMLKKLLEDIRKTIPPR